MIRIWGPMQINEIYESNSFTPKMMMDHLTTKPHPNMDFEPFMKYATQDDDIKDGLYECSYLQQESQPNDLCEILILAESAEPPWRH